ncbi:MAG TPA: mannose-1-phosphate guanylyltransferase/mannose-6-phosphate isomerase [Pseudomonadales bacterium]
MSHLIPVILAGGTGSRLWPLSRELFPKQFHALFSERSLLQETLARADRVTGGEAPIIVCNEEHRFLVAEQCRALGIQWRRLILESQGRNTAPAIGLAALAAPRDATLLVLPSDHLIEPEAAFADAVQQARVAAERGGLVTFGIVPDRPETGYGYICARGEGRGARRVTAFVEKPDLERARSYLAAGDYFWNSGMFVFGASTYLEELQRLAPVMAEALTQAYQEGSVDLDFFRPGQSFLRCPAESVDYAIMEKTERAWTVPAAFGWSDVGSWSSILEASNQDEDGNHFSGDVVAVDTHGSYVQANRRLVGTLGIENLIVVETADAVLVAAKDRVQGVKELVDRLKTERRAEYVSHREVFRPWGSYEGVEQGDRYQVKRIRVKPGERLSLQMHHHRAEHWIVVRGTAEVTRGDQTFMLAENESTYIPLGVTHRLGNPGRVPLELIEVQVGAYLGEDDIVRFEDAYGRSP